MNCPSCQSPVAAGETICPECGTELVVAVSVQAGTKATPGGQQREARSATTCPDCGEVVVPDRNGLCPMCGFSFSAAATIDEDEFFREPPSLEAAMEAERRRLAGLARAAAISNEPQPPSRPAPMAPAAGSAPLPGDRKRARFHEDGSPQPATPPSAFFEVEGGQTVFFAGKMTATVPLEFDELVIGRRDPAVGHYPDIDLGHFRDLDPHISRKHARIFRRSGRWFIEDLCANDATYVNDRAHVLNREAVGLSDGDKVLISDSVALTLRTRTR